MIPGRAELAGTTRSFDAGVRERLIAEHTDSTPELVREAMQAEGSLLRAA